MSRLLATSLSLILLAAATTSVAGIISPAFAKPDMTGALLALSEIKQEEVPAPDADDPQNDGATSPSQGVPFPDPILRLPLPDTPDAASGSEEADDSEDGAESPASIPAEAVPEVIYDLDRLPEEVRRMRELLMEAARSGELERLRPLIGTGDAATQLSFGGAVDDPVAYLRDISGDDEGQEVLAILLEVLESGFVHLDPGTPTELYIWPYFFGVPIEQLAAPQRVELFEIVTAGDYEEMKLYGAYNFYRVGIAPDGRWLFFVAGD